MIGALFASEAAVLRRNKRSLGFLKLGVGAGTTALKAAAIGAGLSAKKGVALGLLGKCINN